MFVHLHCHSYYSLLRGTASPAQIAQRAVELGMPSLALTDTNGVYGAVEFYQACRAVGIKPILGVELTQKGQRAVFLARNRRGWEEICQLTTARQLDERFSLRQAVKSTGANLFVLTDCPDLIVTTPHCRLPTANVYLEINTFMPVQTRMEILEIARREKIPILATNNIYFLQPDDWFLAKILACIRTLSAWESIPPEEVVSREAWFKSELEMETALGEYPSALSATSRIAEACYLKLELGRLHLPRYPLPPQISPERCLRAKCDSGLKKRYGKSFPRLRQRLARELSVISNFGLADYFLLVDEIVRFARSRGISTLGRGSAANSLVCYLLGITAVDPLKYHLYFERFLNPERSDPPDIDVDFPSHRRGEVIEHIYRRFGRERVAMISTTVRFRARSALREVARVMGINERKINFLTGHLPYFSSWRNPEQIRREAPECRCLPWDDERFRALLEIAGQLEGLPRHLSVHPGGVVIAPEPLTHYLALEKAPKGIVVTQPDMYAVKDLGLIKMDILGQRALTVVEDVLREQAGRGIRIDFQKFDPSQDEASGELISSGRTIGCFYIESPVMRNLLKRLKCRDFETLVAASSIIRPGVSNAGLAERYIARRLGREEITSLHPLVDGILRETYGVMIYQEQVMKVVSEAAGMSLAEADQFRRCMSKKPGWKALKNYREQFCRGALRKNIPSTVVDELWRQIEGFSAYAFCKAHSASFALLSCRTAYLKANFPASFMAALISRRGGFYPTREYIQEARRLGLKILPPDINRSEYEYRAEGKGVRVGLMEVKHLRFETSRRILGEREKQPFISWEDFLHRVRPDLIELESLIRSGALSSLEKNRTALLWKLAGKRKTNGPPRNDSRNNGGDSDELFPDFLEKSGPPLPRFAEGLERQRVEEEQGLGFSLSYLEAGDYFQRLKSFAPGLPLIRAEEQLQWAEKKVQLVGWLVTSRLTWTAKGDKLMKFLTLEDESGLFEAVLFPDCYARYGHHLRGPGPFYVRGRIQVKDSTPTVICHFLSDLKFFCEKF